MVRWFAIGDDDVLARTDVAGNLNGQQAAVTPVPALDFLRRGGDPNPWLGVNPDEPTGDDGAVSAGSLLAVQRRTSRLRRQKSERAEPDRWLLLRLAGH